MTDMTPLGQVLASSTQLTTWALAVTAGTIALIVGEHKRPKRLLFRLPYLLFLVGWCFIAKSVYAGNKLTGSYLAMIVAPKNANATASKINDLYATQLDSLLYALMILAIWLVVRLVLWVFGSNFMKEMRREKDAVRARRADHRSGFRRGEE